MRVSRAETTLNYVILLAFAALDRKSTRLNSSHSH